MAQPSPNQPNQPDEQPPPGWFGRYLNRITNPTGLRDLLAVLPLVLLVGIVIVSLGIIFAYQPIYNLASGQLGKLVSYSPLEVLLVAVAVFVLLTVVIQLLLWTARRASWLAVLLLFLLLGFILSYYLVVAFPPDSTIGGADRLLLAFKFNLLLTILVTFAFYPVFLFFSFLVNRKKKKQEDNQSDLEKLDRSYALYANQMFEQVYNPGQYVLPLVLSTILLVVFWTMVLLPDGPDRAIKELQSGNYIESTMQSFLTPKLQVSSSQLPSVGDLGGTAAASPTVSSSQPSATPSSGVIVPNGNVLPLPPEVLTPTLPISDQLRPLILAQSQPNSPLVVASPSLKTQTGRSIIEAGAAFIFAFLGAYIFIVQMLTRRYFRYDLKPAVFVQMTVRLLTATTVAVVFSLFYQKGEDVVGGGGSLLSNVALQAFLYFVIGIFPDLGLRLISSAVNGALRAAQQFFGTVFSNADHDYYSLTEPEPLHLIEGLNVWDQARLLEEGIENVQALATAQIARLFVATAFSAQQLVDWIDQAILMLYVGAEERANWKLLGIRTASDFVDLADRLNNDTGALSNILKLGGEGRAPEGMAVLLAALQNTPNLYYIRNYWIETRPVSGHTSPEAILLPRPAGAPAPSQPPASSPSSDQPPVSSKSVDDAATPGSEAGPPTASHRRPDAAPASPSVEVAASPANAPPTNPPIIFYSPDDSQPSAAATNPATTPTVSDKNVDAPTSSQPDPLAPVSPLGDSLVVGTALRSDGSDHQPSRATSKDVDWSSVPAEGDSVVIRSSIGEAS